jgi:hypothetical protein
MNNIERMAKNIEKRLPNLCPSCGHTLTVRRFGCESCETTVEGVFSLPTLARLSAEDQALVVSLIKASGSLKELAKEYGVSYPTIRNRLDELIRQVEIMENQRGQ